MKHFSYINFVDSSAFWSFKMYKYILLIQYSPKWLCKYTLPAFVKIIVDIFVNLGSR